MNVRLALAIARPASLLFAALLVSVLIGAAASAATTQAEVESASSPIRQRAICRCTSGLDRCAPGQAGASQSLARLSSDASKPAFTFSCIASLNTRRTSTLPRT